VSDNSIKIIVVLVTCISVLFSAISYISNKNSQIDFLTADKNRLEVALSNATLNNVKLESSLAVQNAAIQGIALDKESTTVTFNSTISSLEKERKALLALVNAKPKVITQYVTQDCNETQVNDANEALSLLLDGVK
jgi:hypothetical protein